MSKMPEGKSAESLKPRKDSAYRGMVETSVFVHWLRSGHMADAEALIDLVERKFNPYHAADGRFTSPPGVTVSYGSATSTAAAYSGNASGTSQRRTQVDRRRRTTDRASVSSGSGFRSRFVRDAVSETTSTADTYFELNKRQRYLDNLRREAGPNPDPQIIADFEDYQNRLNANRKILDERAKIADRNTIEVLRAGLAPLDIGIGLAIIASGRAEFRDYVAVAGAVPIAGTLGKFGKVFRAGSGPAAEGVAISRRSLQHAYKHAKVFGVEGNANKRSLEEFTAAIERHLGDSGTRIIDGTYRGRPVTHFVNPDTGLNVMRDANGNFLSGYKLNSRQLEHVLKDGKLGGG